jgi:hypothetical protein
MNNFFCSLIVAALISLAARADEPTKIDVSVSPDKSAIEFRVGNELVTRYHIAESVAKPYFYPVLAPGGVPVTRAWPLETGAPKETKDHVHQKSAWFCHGDVIPEGVTVVPSSDKHVKGVDFWSEAKGHGKIVCVHVDEPKNGSVTTRNEWRDAGGTKILDETRVISLYSAGRPRLLVLDIDLQASVCPITFGDTKEGAMGVRVRDEIRLAAKDGKNQLVNSNDRSGEKDIWGHPAAWCDYSGEVEGMPAGIAIFDDPKNPAPSCWHSRAYGLMAANPFGRDASGFPAMKGKTDLIKLAKGEHLKLRYGICLHSGDAKEGKVAAAFEEFLKMRP